MATSTTTTMKTDDVFQNLPIGSVEKSIGNNLYGFNHRQIPGMVPMNKDVYGMTFFTRPQLNMTAGNLRNVRMFYPLMTQSPISLQRFVRCSLDPRVMEGNEGPNGISGKGLECPMVDNRQAFIPVLTNNLKSLSGWPDISAPTFSSKAGVYGEVYSHVDGITRNFESFDIDCSFRNTKGDPILYMFYTWVHYQSMVYEGLFIPYIDYILENELDYTGRIYRLILDETRRYVKKIYATGASFPISVPMGSFGDFSSEQPYNDQNKDITIRFRSLGAQYLDDILVKEFNDTVVIFNQEMKAVQTIRRVPNDVTIAGNVVKVPYGLLVYFNHRGYPWIDPNTYELEWWIPKTYYSTKITKMLSSTNMDVAAYEANEGD